MGAVAAYVYKDVTTERPADYWELYEFFGSSYQPSKCLAFYFLRAHLDYGTT